MSLFHARPRAVLGLFSSREDAERAAAQLKESGFKDSDVSILVPRERRSGTLTGFLTGLGVPETEARQYESRVQDGGILVSALGDGKEKLRRAQEVLSERGAHGVSSTSVAPGKDALDTPGGRDVTDFNNPRPIV